MKQAIYISSLLYICVALFITCKQTDTNPCAGAKEPTAAFTMMEIDPYFGFTPYNSDTLNPGETQFTAEEPDAKYEWKLGTDTVVFTKQQFSLNFSNYFSSNYPNVPPIPVTLKVTKNPGTCFPASDSVKYMTRTLYLTNKCLLNGTFRGNFNNDSVSKTVTIIVDTIVKDPQPENATIITGLLNKDSLILDESFSENKLFLYRKGIINFQATTTPPYFNILKVEMMVASDNNHIFIWVNQNNPALPTQYTFTGIRI